MKELNSMVPQGWSREQRLMATNPLREATPSRVLQLLEQFRQGNLREAAMFFEVLEERDAVIRLASGKRALKGAMREWEVMPDDDSPEARAQAEVLTYFWRNVRVSSAWNLNLRGGIGLLVRQMLGAVGHHYAVHEIVWKPVGQRQVTAELRHVPLWAFEARSGELRFAPRPGQWEGEPMEAGRWLVTVGDGLMQAAAALWVLRSLAMRDWATYNERHGMPGLMAQTNLAPGTAEFSALEDALSKFSAEWAGVFGHGTTLTLLEAAGAGTIPYPALIEKLERLTVSLFRGADLSSMSAAGDGAGASLQGGETELLELADARLVSETLQEQIDRRVIEWAFGRGVEPRARFALVAQGAEDTALRLQVWRAARELGVPLAVEDFRQAFALPAPAAGAEVLAAPPASGPGLGALAANSQDRPETALARAFRQDHADLRRRLADFEAQVLGAPDQAIQASERLAEELPGLAAEAAVNGEVARELEALLGREVVNTLIRRHEETL